MEDDLAQKVKDLETLFVAHSESDKEVFKTLATKEDMQKLADSMSEAIKIIKNFKIGISVGEKIVGVSGRTIIFLGGFVMAVAALSGGLKWLLGILGLKWFVVFIANKI